MNYLFTIGMIIGIYSYLPYFRDILKGKTKPHAFTWLIWGSFSGIIGMIQLFENSGLGTIITLMSSICSLCIGITALLKGEIKFSKFDFTLLFGAFLGIVCWYFAENPLWTVLLISFVDFCGFLPTIFKSIRNPFQETLQTYILNGIKFLISILTLSKITLVSAFYPGFIIFTNTCFIVMVLYLRRKMKYAKVA